MEQNLNNDDLIRQLCAAHDEELLRQQTANSQGKVNVSYYANRQPPTHKVSLTRVTMPTDSHKLTK